MGSRKTGNQTTGNPEDKESGKPQLGQLRWRCRRGMRELDQALVAYLDHHYKDADDDEQKAFQYLLSLPDPELMHYVSKGQNEPFVELVDTPTAEPVADPGQEDGGRNEPAGKPQEHEFSRQLESILTKIRTTLTV